MKVLLSFAVSAALVAALLWRVDFGELWDLLRRTHWGWTLLGATLAPVGLWVRARRWRFLFPPGEEPPALVPATMIGYMVNNVLPLRAGELVRVWVVARRWGHGFWTALATLIVERVLDSLVIVLLLAVLMLVIPVPAALQWAAALLLAVDLVAVGVLGVLAFRPARCHAVLARLTRRSPGLERRVARSLDIFVRGLEGVRARTHVAPLVAWTAGAWVVPSLAAWMLLRAVQLELPWIAGWTVLAFVGLSVSIPSAPGYIGVFHWAAALAVGVFGVSDSASVGYALLLHASQFLPTTVVGWVFLVREQLTLAEAARVAERRDPTP